MTLQAPLQVKLNPQRVIIQENTKSLPDKFDTCCQTKTKTISLLTLFNSRQKSRACAERIRLWVRRNNQCRRHSRRQFAFCQKKYLDHEEENGVLFLHFVLKVSKNYERKGFSRPRHCSQCLALANSHKHGCGPLLNNRQ